METDNFSPIKKRRWSVAAAIFAIPFFLTMSGGAMALDKDTTEHYDLKLLGKYLFFDKSISNPTNQACASCHTPSAGWTNGSSGVNDGQVAVSGATRHIPGKENAGTKNAGGLKPPSSAYASLIANFDPSHPPLGVAAGGNFWNGRATGEILLNQLPNLLNGVDPTYIVHVTATADQAFASPFINPVEQGVGVGLEGKKLVCEIVESANYAPLYGKAFNDQELDCVSDAGAELAFGRFALALGAYQHDSSTDYVPDVNAFDSPRDRALAPFNAGVSTKSFPLPDFTDQENLGHDIFYSFAPRQVTGFGAGRCSGCHNNGNGAGTSQFEQYSNNEYENIGIPRNHEIPGDPDPDPGVVAITGCVGEATEDDAVNPNRRADCTSLPPFGPPIPFIRDDTGRHKVPTLRNVDKRPDDSFIKAYGHNGFFKSLKQIVHFYNTAAIKPTCSDDIVRAEDAIANNCWPEPEIDQNINRFFVGNLQLTDEEEDALVAYLKTLSDIPTPKQPKPYSERAYLKGALH